MPQFELPGVFLVALGALEGLDLTTCSSELGTKGFLCFLEREDLLKEVSIC
jgi:hypothetical protein